MARWGMPTSPAALMEATKKRAGKLEAEGKAVDFKELLRLGPDSGVTNIRNTSSKHWQRWLRPDNRCLVPFTSFSEYDTIHGKKVPVWFAADDSRPPCLRGHLDQRGRGWCLSLYPWGDRLTLEFFSKAAVLTAYQPPRPIVLR